MAARSMPLTEEGVMVMSTVALTVGMAAVAPLTATPFATRLSLRSPEAEVSITLDLTAV